MLKTYWPILLCVMLFIFGCSEDDQPSEKEDSACYLTGFFEFDQDNEDGFDSIFFEYDNDGLIQSIRYSSQVLNEDGYHTSDLEILLEYDDDQIVGGEYYSDGQLDSEYTVEYNSEGQVIAIVRSQGSSSLEMDLTYDGDLVIESTLTYDLSGYYDQITSTFTYSGENIVKEEKSDGSYIDYEYDDEMNPFQGNLPMFLFTSHYEYFFSSGNQTQRNEYENEVLISSITYTYAYDDDGYPTGISFLDGDGDDWSGTYGYSCD